MATRKPDARGHQSGNAKADRRNPANVESNSPFAQVPEDTLDNLAFQLGGRNVGGQGNYVILEAEGVGHYVGCNLNIHNLRTDPALAWPAEREWPPVLDGS